jgi:hypothetical protein
MKTPTHDAQGHELYDDAEYERLFNLPDEEFAKLPPDVQEKYKPTSRWHFEQRMGDVVPESIQTGSGMTYREKIEHYRKMKAQVPAGMEEGE